MKLCKIHFHKYRVKQHSATFNPEICAVPENVHAPHRREFPGIRGFF